MPEDPSDISPTRPDSARGITFLRVRFPSQRRSSPARDDRSLSRLPPNGILGGSGDLRRASQAGPVLPCDRNEVFTKIIG
jgi:hypothetical protein